MKILAPVKISGGSQISEGTAAPATFSYLSLFFVLPISRTIKMTFRFFCPGLMSFIDDITGSFAISEDFVS